ncbi:hypothetical protein [Leifsonia sp. Leaf264]|uniref:hypothetical protein n=1 Tax=Leifsonia sp. Leaf264 TaxID=1736314 RepID=UPI0006F416F3|nr:hypothetical protein [Leifsonia sp. Leaf264]KQO99493.1 hypothetical protein ASF30_06050 [Leifsonia sp. Leaf264]
MNARIGRTAIALASGAVVIGSLAGCATDQSAEADTAPSTDGAESTAPTSPSTGTDSTGTDGAEASSSSYTDGEYTETGDYTTPGGQEDVTVTITLADDIVTAVEVTGSATSGNSKQYQSAFISGIAAEVVGKDIDDLDVSKVAGSSLTSSGFNAALDAIRSDAA